MAGKTVVGLEITEESVRAAEVTRGPSPSLVAFGEVPLPDGAAKDSEVLDKDAVALALHQLWASSGIKQHSVVLGVGSRRILVREHSTPTMSIENIRAALPYQVQDLLPVPVNQAVLDFYPYAEDQGTVHGLLVAAVSETIEDLVATLTKAKLRTERVDLLAFGLARASRALSNADEATVMIHIGDHTTYLVAAVNGVPRFVRIIPAEVSTAATERRNTVEILEEDPVEVAVVTDRGGRASLRIAAVQPQTSVVAAETSASVSDLANRLRSTIEYYNSRPGSVPIGAIMLSGAGAANPAIIPALHAALNRPVNLLDVGAVLGVSGTHPEGDLAHSLVGTVGFVMGEGK